MQILLKFGTRLIVSEIICNIQIQFHTQVYVCNVLLVWVCQILFKYELQHMIVCSMNFILNCMLIVELHLESIVPWN